ncbi:cytoplasmic polyadenylated homeobox-like protein 2 [Sciurus carolinensis]|uniref:cytoplasmic polyadenylated homeobox-like protein 2 n=1 Tax=Sciurus carolinensis TaxID=30640 RepID=UPI001FB56D31|nr:cytoplasmic polyadenylated homeobox-like protein 2 [Sciurus carolinensis]
MASEASSVEHSPKGEEERKHERGKGKPRHKFTKHELEILNQLFKQNPYPEFSTREELANQMDCQLCIINNWFQNKRARLRCREKQRTFVTGRKQESLVQAHPAVGHQDAQVQSHNSTTSQPSWPQQAPLGGAGYFSKETWGLAGEEDHSCDAVVPGIRMEASSASEWQMVTGSAPSPSSTPAMHSHPASSLQGFERATFSTEESQHGRPLLLPYVDSVQGNMQQQELLYQNSVYEGQQENDWGYYLHQLPQPQYHQEMLFQDPFLVPQKQGNLEQQVSSLLQQQDAGCEGNGEALSSQEQCTSPPQMVTSSLPEPPGQDGQLGALEQPRFPTLDFWEEVSAEDPYWPSIISEGHGIAF